VTFATYTLVFKHTLDAATAFTAITLLKVVSQLLTYLPHQIMEIFKAKVALERINKFLEEPELQSINLLNSCSSSNEYLTQRSTDTLFVGDDNNRNPSFNNADFCYHGYRPKSSDLSGTVLDESLLGPTDSADCDENNNTFFLRNLNCNFPLNGLSIVMGPTGSGKSSLLLALLGGILILIFRNETNVGFRSFSIFVS
jgi:ABC-type multidrug transport system fused ATPase/permease subunit